MSTRKACLPRNSLGTVVASCLQRLRILALNIDIYGSEEDAANLREIIQELETTSPQKPDTPAGDFVVQGLFKVRRAQVANLLCCAFGESAPSRFEIIEFIQPPSFGFRAHPALVPRHLDYPLNEGGWLGIRSNEHGSELFRLDLKSIASGLNTMASECPRHFVDFLNHTADSITGDAFLQCCFFGKMTG